MTHMLCRNRVADFDAWWKIFSSHTVAQEISGLLLEHVWRSTEDPNNVFFIFDVLDMDKARAFISSPAAAEAGKVSGVIDGEYHFVESTPHSGQR